MRCNYYWSSLLIYCASLWYIDTQVDVDQIDKTTAVLNTDSSNASGSHYRTPPSRSNAALNNYHRAMKPGKRLDKEQHVVQKKSADRQCSETGKTVACYRSSTKPLVVRESPSLPTLSSTRSHPSKSLLSIFRLRVRIEVWVKFWLTVKVQRDLRDRQR